MPALHHIIITAFIIILVNSIPDLALSAPPLDIRLFNYLLNNETYSKRALPVLNITVDRVKIYISVEINRINSLDDKTEVFSWVGYVNVTWNNPHLRWKPEDWGGIRFLQMRESDMWVPDVSILERLDDDVGFSDQKRRLIKVQHNGDVKWFLGGGMIDVPCKLKMNKFPFDQQCCGMSIGSYAMSNREVEILHSNSTMIGEHLGKNGMWDVDSFKTRMKTMLYETTSGPEEYNYLYLEVYLHRKPTYYILNIIAPCIFISVLMCTVFILPADGGEKIGFSITLLVAFNVIQLVIIGMMPQTSDTLPIIAIYVTTLLALSALCVPLSVLVIHVHNNGDRHLPRCLSRLLFPKTNDKMSLNHVNQDYSNMTELTFRSDPDSPVGEGDTFRRTLEEIRMELAKLRTKRDHENFDRSQAQKWRNAAARLDNFFLKIFAPVLLIHTVVCLMIMMIP